MEYGKKKQLIAGVSAVLFMVALPLYSVGARNENAQLMSWSIYGMFPMWVFMLHEFWTSFGREFVHQIRKLKGED